MRPNRLYNSQQVLTGFAALVLLMVSSCRPTKYLAEDEYLLDRYRVQIDEGHVDEKEMETYVKPKPNKQILGMKFYLGLYNLSGEKDNGFNRWLRKIGEAPVLYDQYETERNTKQIGLYMKNKGYYNAVVIDSVKFKKQQAQVKYEILPGRPYVIRSIKYELEDTSSHLCYVHNDNTDTPRDTLTQSHLISKT